MHFVILEPKWRRGGHHPSWAAEICLQLLGKGHDVLLMCPEPYEIQQLFQGRISAEASNRFQTWRIPDVSDLRNRHPKHISFDTYCVFVYAACFLRARVRLCIKKPYLYFGLLDIFVGFHRSFIGRLLANLFFCPIIGIYFFPNKLLDPPVAVTAFTPEHYGFFRADIFKLLIVLAESHAKHLATYLGNKVACLPDFAPAAFSPAFIRGVQFPEVGALTSRANGRKIIAVLGDLHPRKGLLTFLRAARLANNEPWLFYASGEISKNDYTADDWALIQESEKLFNVMYSFGRIKDDLTFSALVACADVIYACYLDFPYSSNMLAQAALRGKPLLVAGDGEMKARVERYHLGEFSDPKNEAEAFACIKKILEAPPSYMDAVRQGAKEYLEYHNSANYINKLESLILEPKL